MSKLILGIGSPFADDKVGWLVAELLLSMPELGRQLLSGQLVIDRVDRPGLNLLIWLEQDYQQIILIDMVKTNLAKPGNVYHLQAQEVIGFCGMLSSHNLGVSPSLALAQALGMNLAGVCLWGIEGVHHSPEYEISAAVLDKVVWVAQQIVNEICCR